MKDNFDNDETTGHLDFPINGTDNGIDDEYLELQEREQERASVERYELSNWRSDLPGKDTNDEVYL